MNEMTIGTSRLTGYLVSMLGLGGQWILPDRNTGETLDPAKLLQIRQELEETGLVELDFDGKLHPTEKFARDAYTLKHVRAALRWAEEDEIALFLRGPVDDLLLRCRWDLWTLERVRPSAVLNWARDLAGSCHAGTLAAVDSPNGIPQEYVLQEKEDRSGLLTLALDIYFGGGDQNA